MTGFDPTSGMPVWFARRALPEGATAIACVLGDAHPYRHVIDTTVSEEPGTVLYRGEYTADGEMTSCVVDPAFQQGGIDLWYVEESEQGADPPATNLLAFATPEWPDGSIVSIDDADARGVDLREQVGALRWWTETGQVHQVYVAAHMRRRRIGSKLTLTGAALTLGRRWPSLWATGELTDMGAVFVSRAPWTSRVAPRSMSHPPMTPTDAWTGIP